MPDTGTTGIPEFREHLADLANDPRPAVRRAALAARYPSWGVATLALLVVGLLVGFASLRWLGDSINECVVRPAMPVCGSAGHPVVVVLPVAGFVLGLAISLIGGRYLVGRGRSPLVASSVGWWVFLVGTVVAYLLAGRY